MYIQFPYGLLILFAWIPLLRAFDANEDIYFELYTNENPENYQVIRNSQAIRSTTFNPYRPTRIFVHGFRSDRNTIKQYSKGFLRAENVNFIAMNWIDGAETLLYPVAKNRVEEAGSALSELITGFLRFGMQLHSLVVVGHSLGAHIAGMAGKKLIENQRVRIGAIIGLDPAGVLFDVNETNYRLADTDADYVQVIHTDIDDGRLALGIGQPIGHGDFYPNFGKLQPGCLENLRLPLIGVVGIPAPIRSFGNTIIGCSHGRAHEYYLESLTNIFIGVQCRSFAELSEKKCDKTGIRGLMGGDVAYFSNRPRGIYYLETNSVSPFAIRDTNLFNKIDFGERDNATASGKLLSTPTSFFSRLFGQ